MGATLSIFTTMKSKFLFPPYFAWLGWVMAIPGLVLGCFNVFGHFVFNFLETGHHDSRLHYNFFNYTDEVALAITIVGLLLIAFAKKKQEDELIARLRMDALYWSILINGFIYLALSPFDVEEFYTYNLGTPLIIFIARFNYLLHFKKDAFIISEVRLLPFKPWRIIAIGLTVICAVLIAVRINLGDSIVSIIVIGLYLGLYMCVFSRNRFEDELTMQYRMNSMYLAVLLNYTLLLVANFVFYGMDFLAIMVYNMVTIPIFFICIFGFYNLKNAFVQQQQVKGGLLL